MSIWTHHRLTLYLFSPICSTWNLLAHLHWATCRVTWREQTNISSAFFSVCLFVCLLFYLVLDLVGVGGRPVGVLVGVKSCHELVVIDVAVSVPVKDVRHGRHLQPAGWKLCRRDAELMFHQPNVLLFKDVFRLQRTLRCRNVQNVTGWTFGFCNVYNYLNIKLYLHFISQKNPQSGCWI